ncbi:class I SAM-dependent methyltransferase [Clostridium saccharoperbutylacetonicum]|uniref:class I SAM-dependent methyltransferase n=1 Tax=Clostridium saccharoperbutylacetonicum TaxID=36745 RepID=UPI000983F689|nr:class I SAM-dependent methyltransferase [Clostridium saccharoperbutylacetonicum]AQR97006.1 ubiquinone/menaquinone biosynthesis C-methyltransferase UbiE [Clostridium saccharoperbutylacetonicum]NSB32885.1 ubiquinone/menaquinone biosynthesis C-methylase UbiE [Clostridium saccharoperbutylacetonicum]
MKHGDFTELAKYYIDRPGYSLTLLDFIKTFICKTANKVDIKVADVGAGTGKLTENLETLGLTGFAVEPNDAMRAEGIKLFGEKSSFEWLKGSAEITNLPDSCVDWVLMGSSFHWTDDKVALKEFYRILKPGGFFTAIWNPRDIEGNELHEKIENIVYSEVKNMKRVSSGLKLTTNEMKEKLFSTPYFEDLIFMEAPHSERMSKERYMNIWQSVNDIQVQAGKEGFLRILNNIEKEISDLDEIWVPYRSRAWTVRAKKK